jgi:hypothetical protein
VTEFFRLFFVFVLFDEHSAMYFFPLLVLRELREQFQIPLEVLVRGHELYEQEMSNLHIGQALDIWWHAGNHEATEDEYLQMYFSLLVLVLLLLLLLLLLINRNDFSNSS